MLRSPATVADMVPPVARAWHLVRRHPTIADGVIAVVLAAVAMIAVRPAWQLGPDFTEPDPVAFALILVQTLPLTFRRWQPMAAYIVVGVTSVVYAQLGYPPSPAGFGVLIAIYTVATIVPLRDAIIAAGIYVAGMLLSLVAVYSTVDAPPEAFLPDVLFNTLLLVLAWTVGVTIRTRRAYVAELETRGALLEREREDNAQLAIALERGRMARELHDVVAHSLSVVVVQAGAAERLVEQDPARAREALASIGATGREALVEMRRLLGAVRGARGSERAPQPGLADLDALIERTRRAGLPVELSQRGDPRPLPATVELSAYRLVQEALTNVLRHAGEARARVLVHYTPDALEVRVTDTGLGARAESSPAGGHGLIGMRERISLFGGDLQAGPRPEGGFAVTARIPLDGQDR